MGLAVTDDHAELAATVRRWAEARGLLADARAALEAPNRGAAGHEGEVLPSWWAEVAEMGWLGMAVAVEHGGQGYGLAELAVVLEELGRWCAPGPLLPTVIAAVAVDRWALDAGLARPLVDGTMVGGLALAGDLVVDDAGRLSGRVRGVWGGCLADRFLLPVARPEAPAWCVVDRADLEVKALASFDATRGLAEVRLDGADIGPERWLSITAAGAAHPEGLVRLAELLAGAEALGVADWCVGEASPLRRGAGAVRPAHRPVPGGEAPLRRHARGAGVGTRRRLGCGPLLRRRRMLRGGRDRRAVGRGRARTGGGVSRRPGLHPGPRGHRLHVGARRPPVPQARHRHPPPAAAARGRPPAAWPRRWPRASAGRCRSSCRRRPSRCGPRCASSSRTCGPTTGPSGAAGSPMRAIWRPIGPGPGAGTPRPSSSW